MAVSTQTTCNVTILSLFSTIHFICIRHPFSRQQPFRAFFRFARWQVRAHISGRAQLVHWTNTCRLWLSPGLRGATGNYYCGLHEFEDMSFLLHLLRPEDLFADAGANVGTYKVLAAGHTGARVTAFEPGADALAWLHQNISANGAEGRVRVVAKALSHRMGTVYFTRHLDAMNHVLEGPEADSLSVPCTTLDDSFPDSPPLLIKIDVEGNEHRVLQGAEHLLRQPALKGLIVETTTQPFRPPAATTTHEWLLQQGFAAYTYEPFSRRLIQLAQPHHHNTLYLRDLDFIRQRLQTATPFVLWERSI